MSFLCGSSTVLGDGRQVYPITAFDDNTEAPIDLIEVTSDETGSSRRLAITEDLIKTYIEKDFGVFWAPLCIHRYFDTNITS